ncbi:DUF1156 domain-containing protein [Actinoplanes sp. NPDC051851]|uniref:DUF1156 domain-containing protein n=1 Tax=Actinoplanes sp. NPDC051851 TaxID=3154753 RepID=UPI003425B2AB
MSVVRKRKLIEVSLPLKAINLASAREKSIRYGHPSTLHPWWARRPLAACRAVLFAQLVDDPSSHPEKFPSEDDVIDERKRLHKIIEDLVSDKANDEIILAAVRKEIWESCNGDPPLIMDPFAGSGSIPLEAQRLGLEARATDLNPVAVLISKALIEIPPRWAGRPPVFPGAADSQKGTWNGAKGLAEDVRRYGGWLRDEAKKRIGHFYPSVGMPDGAQATVIAWIWARIVLCPNPACSIHMPLVRSWWLGKKRGREAYLVPRVVNGKVKYSIGTDDQNLPQRGTDGTIRRNSVLCIGCGSPASLSYVREEGNAGRLGVQLLAIAAEGPGRRVYLPPSDDHVAAANVPKPDHLPEGDLANDPRNLWCVGYGFKAVVDLFTNRQLVALTTLCDLVKVVGSRVEVDCRNRGMRPVEATAYATAISTYLAMAVSRQADYSSSITTWMPDPKNEGLRNTFARQAIPMAWDFAEVNIFSSSSGNWDFMVRGITRVLDSLSVGPAGSADQGDARYIEKPVGTVLSTDPPYYDNVSYAALSDFFYIWLRRTLRSSYPNLFSTVVTPKEDELIADPIRHGGRENAAEFFRVRYQEIFTWLRRNARSDLPITVYYAYKQSEITDSGESSTGWDALLDGMLRAGWTVQATWPIRTERSGRMRDIGSNALASSIVLACRPRSIATGRTDRSRFVAELRRELPDALRSMQEESIAPVDLAQAAIGPGVAIFSKYAGVVEPDGSAMSVRTALALINQVLAEVLTEHDGELDADSRFALKWFEQHGWEKGKYGDAETIAKAYNTSVPRLKRAGIFSAQAGSAQLIAPEDLLTTYGSAGERQISWWRIVLQIVHNLEDRGVEAAAGFMAEVKPQIQDLYIVKELAYSLFAICERKRWSRSALRFNNLVASWSDLDDLARTIASLNVGGEGDLG